VGKERREEHPPVGAAQRFRTTNWSVVFAAGDPSDDAGRDALSTLCRAYWPPVYAFIRRRGEDPESSRDLAQGFFATLLEKGTIGRADPRHGRFRSFLLTSLKHYIANERNRERATKRGGGEALLPLDLESAEAGYRLEPAHTETPEKIYDRRWALTLLEHVMDRLREERASRGEPARFERLQGLLTGEAGESSYRDLASELGMTEEAVKAAIYRLRRRYGELLREEVARTTHDPSEVDAEIGHLLSVLESQPSSSGMLRKSLRRSGTAE